MSRAYIQFTGGVDCVVVNETPCDDVGSRTHFHNAALYTGYEDLDEAVSYVRSNASNFTQKEATIALNNISTVCESLVDEAATPEPESTQEEEIAEAISPLDEAFKQCDFPRGVRVTDEGETLIIRTTGDDTDVRASFADVTCILRELEAPSRTLHRMETTRSLDGRVTDSWDDYTAEWTYHPDDGLNVIIFVTQDK